ncbi:hypothetical protein [Methylobacterium sp. 391_Methyba4]|nr:hypothetical protein [Methylobacterium sp. 391_Methyba4]WFS09635.1 hypothetical protein P9K36_10255 [Methylobacterium sp. 391_Methyba4]
MAPVESDFREPETIVVLISERRLWPSAEAHALAIGVGFDRTT